MGHPLLERCVANGKCVIVVGGVRPELGTCSALSVGRVPRSLTMGWARGGHKISGLQATPTTWHMSTPQDMGCISVSARSVCCISHSTGTHVSTCAGAPVYTPTEQTIRKKPRTQIYANKRSMATARKQSLRTGMGRASARRCRTCAHDGHARAWLTHAMNMNAHAMGFVDVDCVNVNAAGNLRA